MDIGRRHALGLLAGLAAAMALTPVGDQFSQFLRYAFLRSPNYQAGLSGWTINQDGSVEFNNGTFRGTVTAGTFQGTDFVINSAGAFFYSGTPASGNLIVAIANAAGSDAFGNSYAQGITVVKGAIAGGQINAGTVGNTQMGVGAVQALNLNVGSAKNLIIDPQFTISGLSSARTSDAHTTGTWTIASNTATDTSNVSGDRMALTLSSGVSLFVVPGEQYFCSVSAALTASGGSGTAGIEFLYDTGATSTVTATISSTGFTTVSGTITIPAGVKSAQVFLLTNNGSSSGNIEYQAPLVYLTSGTSEIQAGAITATQIAANTITVAQLAAGIIYAGIVDGTTITGSVIVVNNSHGARIMTIDKTAGTWLLYKDLGSSSQGDLVASGAGASGGTDEFGKTYDAGITVYSPSPVNAVTQLLNGFLNVGTPGQMAGTGGAAVGQIGLASGGNPGVVRIDSGLTATGDTDAFVDVRSKNAQSSISGVTQRNIQLAGPLALSSEGSAPSQLVTAAVYDGGNGFARMRTGSVTSDTVVYQIGHAIFRNTTDQTGVGTGATVITGLSANLGIGLYNFRGMITLANPTGATITPTIGFSGSGGLALANLDVGQEWYDPVAGTFKGSGKVSILGNGTSPTSGVGASGLIYVKFDGVINVSTAGTFQVFAQGSAINLTVKAFSRIVHWQDN